MGTKNPPRIPLPKSWGKYVRIALLHVVALARYATAYTRGWATNSLDALHTGCRRGELLGLEWSRVDLKEGLFYLEGVHTKSGKRRSVPLNQVARTALINRARFRAKWCPDSPWVFCTRKGTRIQSVRGGFLDACAQAGISDFRIHDMRHSAVRGAKEDVG